MMILKNIFSLNRSLHNRIFTQFSKQTSSSHYYQNKAAQQRSKIENAFINDEKKLKVFRANMTELAPSFFTKELNLHENQKIIQQDKSGNELQNSYVALEIPAQSEPELSFALKKMNSNEIRIGRILEVMDSIAGMVGYRHCFGSLSEVNPFILVTGSVDQINLFSTITHDKNIKMEGYINRVGTTSMEIQINLYQQKQLKSTALFTMIARQASNQSKGYRCPKLLFQSLTSTEMLKAENRLKKAEEHVKRRKIQMRQSFEKSPPKLEEIAILHELWLNERAHTLGNHTDINQTQIFNTLVMHIQQRNVHGKIFGGFLMREMIESGWIAANFFVKGGNFTVLNISNIYFKRPVEIGSTLKISSKITYTCGDIFVVTVQASSLDSDYTNEEISCQLQIFIESKGNRRNVVPHSYENGLKFLQSRKAYEDIFKQ